MFLETLANLSGEEISRGDVAIGAGIMAVIFAFILLWLLIMVAVYVYCGFAYSAIARKAKLESPGIAWIPVVGPLLIAYQSANMPSWPWWLLTSIILVMIHPLFEFITCIAMIVFAVYAVIWHWKMFEKIKYPGWWAILCLISPLNLILVGIAAWSKK